MKSKKSAFTHTSTGYGRSRHGSNKHNSKSEKSSEKEHLKELAKCDGDKSKSEQDQDLNSGFGDYLRTPEAFEMMKLFVFANTIMLIVTMAWPHIREQFFMLNQWWESFQTELN